MSLGVYKRTYRFIQKNSDSIDIIVFKYARFLNALKYTTTNELNNIEFEKRKSIEYRGDLNPIKNGTVRIHKENHNIRIEWKIKLERLYLYSILLGIFIGLFSGGYFAIEGMIMTGFTITIFFLILGFIRINKKLTEINYTCLEL